MLQNVQQLNKYGSLQREGLSSDAMKKKKNKLKKNSHRFKIQILPHHLYHSNCWINSGVLCQFALIRHPLHLNHR